MMGSHL